MGIGSGMGIGAGMGMGIGSGMGMGAGMGMGIGSGMGMGIGAGMGIGVGAGAGADIAIKGGMALLADGAILRKDILVIGGRIAAIEDEIDAARHGAAAVDARGLVVLPGLIDAHCHLREPGFEYKEDIASGTAAAARGGFTAVACMPNTDPVADNAPVVEHITAKAAAAGRARVMPIGAATKGLRGEELAEVGMLVGAGAVAISDDGRPISNASLMKKAMLYAKMFDIPVISHSESLELSEGGDMNEGFVSLELGLRGIPSVAESVAVARDALLCEYTGARVHIAHVSTRASVDAVRAAKRRGARITCETCPHYFTLTDEACRGYDTNAKMNPPLATGRDVEAVIEGLADGTIDIIATDHAPHHLDDKDVEFSLAANGIVGLETAFGLSYTRLVLGGALTLAQLAQKMSRNPALLFGLGARRGSIEVGYDADLTAVDTERRYAVDPSAFLSKARNTPFAGMELQGAAAFTVVGGRVVEV